MLYSLDGKSWVIQTKCPSDRPTVRPTVRSGRATSSCASSRALATEIKQ
ncbi:unnamed protein product, partial [Didymodactylos carnosus]